MADTLSTLNELIRFNSLDVNPAEITDILNKAPVLRALHAMQASNGTVHKFNVETTAPVIGFRAVNAGADYTASISTQTSVDLKYIDAKVIEDAAACRAYRFGAEAWMNQRTARQIREALFTLEKQIFNGTVGGSADGFLGLADSANYNGASVALVGSGDQSLSTPNINFTVGEIFESVVLGSNSKSMVAMVRDAGGHLGVQIGSKYAVARIANLTEDSGKGLTDTLLARALALFPASDQPTHICMNRRSLRQLQVSRTTYSPTGMPAPRPTEYEGIPIVVTDAITSTETLLA